MDVLADLLERSRARGAAFAHSSLTGPWALEFPEGPGLAVHAVIAGETWIEREGADPVRAVGGDVLLVRGEVPHRLAAAPGTPGASIAALQEAGAVAGSPRRFVAAFPLQSASAAEASAPGAPEAVFFCGAYRFAGDLCSSLIAALPDVVHLRPAAGGLLRGALDLLAREMDRDAPGQQTILDRLLDVVLVHLLREHFASAGAQGPAWFRALDDPEVGRALRAVHADPARPWTVASLAAEVGLSRAAFARRFTALVGDPPLEYLTGWRMALAREQLRDTRDGLAAVAQAVGYASEFAFAAAFKRHHGVAPGRWRAAAREAA